MRKFGLFLCLSLLFAFTGCSDSDDVEEQGGTVLAKPTVVVTTTTSAAFKVKWDAVPNAESYKYRLSQENESGEEITVQSELATSANALAFSDLNPKTKYILRVKAVAAGGSGLADSDYAKIFAVTLAEEPTALTFEKIAATNPTYESVDVEIVPSAENLYYWQVVENSLVADKSDREIVAALKENISELTSGTVKKTIHGLKAETEYTIVAFGYDIDANKSTSAVARLEKAFTTPADTRMTIRIAVGEVSDDNAHVTFTPSIADGRYFADVIAAADAAGKSDMEIVALLQAKYGAAMTDIARTGKYEMDAALEAKTNYVAVAFGYDVAASEFLTQLFRADIKNGGANPDFSDAWADMACVYGSFNDGSPALGANVYPNEQTASIKMGMLTLRGSASSLEEVGLTAEQLRDEILKQGETLPESLKDEDGSYQAVYHIEYGKVYLFANVALDAAGKGGEVNWFIARAQTSAQGSPDILGMSERNDDGSEDPGELSDAWVNMSGIYQLYQGQLYMGARLYPDAKTETVKTYTRSLPKAFTSLEETGITEEDLRIAIISRGETITPQDGAYGALYAVEPSTVLLISTAGVDATGATGAANWMIIQAPATTDGKPTVLAMSAKNDETGGSGGEEEEPTEAYSKYLGTWTVTSTSSTVSKKPLTFDITIEPQKNNLLYSVTGFACSVYRSQPTPWGYDAEHDMILPLCYNFGTVQHNTYGPYTLEYQPYIYIRSEDKYSPLQCEPADALFGGQLSDGKFTMIGLSEINIGTETKPLLVDAIFMDFFGFLTGEYEGYVLSYKTAEGFTDDDYPVGPFVLTAKNPATATAASVGRMTNLNSGACVLRDNRPEPTSIRNSLSSVMGRIQYLPKGAVNRAYDNILRSMHQVKPEAANIMKIDTFDGPIMKPCYRN